MQQNLAFGKRVSNIPNAQAVTEGNIEQYDANQGFGHFLWPCDVIIDLEVLCKVDTIFVSSTIPKKGFLINSTNQPGTLILDSVR
jgi:hypothetical protein